MLGRGRVLVPVDVDQAQARQIADAEQVEAAEGLAEPGRPSSSGGGLSSPG